MKIVIDIDESILNDAKNGYVRLDEIADAVLSGTPLPKGHGRLIDADALIPDRDYYEGGGYDAVSCEQIDKAPTIDDLSEYSDKLWKEAYERGKAEERPQEASECIPVKDLINFIRNCREEVFDKMKDYHQRESLRLDAIC